MKALLLTATAAALLAASDAYPNYYFHLEGKDWITGNEGPMGTGELRDGSVNGLCEISDPDLFANYKPNTMYSFSVTSSTRLGFKLKLTAESSNEDPGVLHSRLFRGKTKYQCGNGHMDRKKRTVNRASGQECYSISREYNKGYFRWKSPSKPGQRFQLNVICASGHRKKGEDGPVSYASVPYKSVPDISFETSAPTTAAPTDDGAGEPATAAPTDAPTIDTELCSGFGGMKKCNAVARCKWSNKQCNLLPAPCGGLKLNACKANAKCRFFSKKCLLKPECDTYKKKMGCNGQKGRCVWTGKVNTGSCGDFVARPSGCANQKTVLDCKAESANGAEGGCKWQPKKSTCVVTASPP